MVPPSPVGITAHPKKESDGSETDLSLGIAASQKRERKKKDVMRATVNTIFFPPPIHSVSWGTKKGYPPPPLHEPSPLLSLLLFLI